MTRARKTSGRKGRAAKSFLIQSDGNSKKFYTREDDETIVRMSKAGSTAKEIGESLGHTEASVRYRKLRVLAFLKNFKEYDYTTHRIRLTKDELNERRQAVLDNQDS